MPATPTHGGVRKGAGRKPETGEKRENLVKVYLTDAEYAELLDASGAAPLGPWIRDAALAAARETGAELELQRRGLDEPPVTAPPPRQR